MADNTVTKRKGKRDAALETFRDMVMQEEAARADGILTLRIELRQGGIRKSNITVVREIDPLAQS